MKHHKEIEKRTIDSRDIAGLLDRSQRTGRRYMQAIRKYYGKNKGQKLSIKEFCDHTGLPVQAVMQYKLDQIEE